jgi:hypothetical protein
MNDPDRVLADGNGVESKLSALIGLDRLRPCRCGGFERYLDAGNRPVLGVVHDAADSSKNRRFCKRGEH